jgi:hypothetical protein
MTSQGAMKTKMGMVSCKAAEGPCMHQPCTASSLTMEAAHDLLQKQ